MSTDKKKVSFNLKLTPEQKEKIHSLAHKRGVSQKKLVMDLVDREAEKEPINIKPGSLLNLNQDLFRIGDGPVDGSTNPVHMQGYGR